MSSTQYVVQVVKIRLRPDAAGVLSKKDFDHVTAWLEKWTPRNNLKAVIKPTRQEGIGHLKAVLHQALVPSWLARETGVTPGMFEFEVSAEEVQDDEFWATSSIVWGRWHSVGDDE
jgi:hypothetical protein